MLYFYPYLPPPYQMTLLRDKIDLRMVFTHNLEHVLASSVISIDFEILTTLKLTF